MTNETLANVTKEALMEYIDDGKLVNFQRKTGIFHHNTAYSTLARGLRQLFNENNSKGNN